jgi:DNA (cytosine-5)-methyltransferase 1
MGFDKDRTPDMIIPVSDTRAYQQFGNSVVVPVIEAIAKAMRPGILELLAAEQEATVQAAE